MMSFFYKFTQFIEIPGLNFINILHTAFKCTDPENVKDTDDLTVLFYAFEIYGHKSFE